MKFVFTAHNQKYKSLLHSTGIANALALLPSLGQRTFYILGRRGGYATLSAPHPRAMGGYKKLIEVKAGKTINTDYFRGINYFKKIYKGKSRIKAYLIYGGDNEYNHMQTHI